MSEKYWELHPELTPVKVGDDILPNVRWTLESPTVTVQQVDSIDFENEVGTIRYKAIGSKSWKYFEGLHLEVICNGRKGFLEMAEEIKRLYRDAT